MTGVDAFLAQWGAYVAVVGMAAMTYVWRGGGYFLMGFVQPHPRITRALAALPGSVIVATVLPLLIRSGPSALVAVGVALVLMVWRRNDFLACGAGLCAAILARMAGL